MMRAAIVAVAFFCAGCAAPDLVIRKGKIADGAYLVTWRATDRVGFWCDQTPDAAGCEQIRIVAIPGGFVRAASIVVRRDHEMLHEIAAHEVCHAVAGAQGILVDPCHNEDDGKLPLRVDPH